MSPAPAGSIPQTTKVFSRDLGGGLIHEAFGPKVPTGYVMEVEHIALLSSAVVSPPPVILASISDTREQISAGLLNVVDMTSSGAWDRRTYYPRLRVAAGNELHIMWFVVGPGATCYASIQYVLTPERRQ